MKKLTIENPHHRIAVSPAEAAALLSIDRATFYRRVMPAVYARKIQSLRIGTARRIFVTSLLEWAHAEAERDAA